MMTHVKNPSWAHHTQCNTGAIPSSDVGRSISNAYQYHKNWRQLDMICRYSGIPGADYHGGATNDFYVITPVSTPADSTQTTRKYALFCKRWNYDYWTDPGGGADYTKNVDLNGSQLGSYTVDIRSAYDAGAGTPQDERTPPGGPGYVWVADLSQSLIDSQYSNGYRYDVLSVDEISVASFAVMSLPEYSVSLDASQGLVDGNFSNGHTLRGYTGTSDTGTSVGAVVHNTDNATDGILQNTKNCILNYMHPAGCLVNGTSTAYVGVKEYTDSVLGSTPLPFRARGKNLRNRTSFTAQNLDLCFCAQWDTGAKLRVSSAQLSVTNGYNLPGSSVGTPTFVSINDFTRFDPRGDEITVEFEVDSTKSVIVHSFSLFETTGDEV